MAEFSECGPSHWIAALLVACNGPISTWQVDFCGSTSGPTNITAGRVSYQPKPQYDAWMELGQELNRTGRPIYYSICPHTMASQRGTAKNYSGIFPAVPPIYAPPVSWTASQRHQLANSLLVEYQNTVDAWYVPGVDKHGHG